MATGVVFAKITYAPRFELTYKLVEQMSPCVDYCIVVCEEQRPYTENQKAELKKFSNLIYVERPFIDSIPSFRNQYLCEAWKLKEQNKWESLWLITCDSDEYFSLTLRRDLKAIISEAEKQGVSVLGINCREMFSVIHWSDSIEKLRETPSEPRIGNYFKNLIFKVCCEKFHYWGIGMGTTHETWGCPTHPFKVKMLPRRYWYVQQKSTLDVWRNACRNVFAGGGGNAVGVRNPFYVKLKELCSQRNIYTWREYESFLKGEVDEEFERFLVECLDAPSYDWGQETREMAKFYFATHPKRLTTEILEKIKKPPPPSPAEEIMKYVEEQYLKVLGRHADDRGKEAYTQAILQGKIRKEQLPELLRRSPEFQQRFPEKAEEKVRLSVPVDVDVRISSDAFMKALMKSKTYWEILKPRMDLGKFLESRMQAKRDFYKWFYAQGEELTLEKLVEKLTEDKEEKPKMQKSWAINNEAEDQ